MQRRKIKKLPYSKLSDDLYHNEIFPKLFDLDLFELRLVCKNFKTLADKALSKQKHNIKMIVDRKPSKPFPFQVESLTIQGFVIKIRSILHLLHKYAPNSINIYGNITKSKIEDIGAYTNPINISYDCACPLPIPFICAAITHITTLFNLPTSSIQSNKIKTFPLTDLVYFRELKNLNLIQKSTKKISKTKLLSKVKDFIFWHHIVLSFDGLSENITRIFSRSKANLVIQKVTFGVRTLLSCTISINPIEYTDPDRKFHLEFYKVHKADVTLATIPSLMTKKTNNPFDYKFPLFSISGAKIINIFHDDNTPIFIKELLIENLVFTGTGTYLGCNMECDNPYVTIGYLNFVGNRFKTRLSNKIVFNKNADTAMQYKDDVRVNLFGTNIGSSPIFNSDEPEIKYINLDKFNAKIHVIDLPFTLSNVVKNWDQLHKVEILNLHPVKDIIVHPKIFFNECVLPIVQAMIMKLDCEVNIIFGNTKTLIKKSYRI